MEKRIENTELTDQDLDNVTGGGLLHFIYQTFVAGNEDTNKDPNLATHTASYKVYAS